MGEPFALTLLIGFVTENVARATWKGVLFKKISETFSPHTFHIAPLTK